MKVVAAADIKRPSPENNYSDRPLSRGVYTVPGTAIRMRAGRTFTLPQLLPESVLPLSALTGKFDDSLDGAEQ